MVFGSEKEIAFLKSKLLQVSEITTNHYSFNVTVLSLFKIHLSIFFKLVRLFVSESAVIKTCIHLWSICKLPASISVLLK